MDFDLTEEQRMLKKSVGDFLRKEAPKNFLRQLEEGQEGYDPELWRKMAGLGWMGLVLPASYEGSGGDFFDLIVLLEEMGYHLCSGPFFSTVILGGLTILRAGSEEQKKKFLPKMAEGKLFCTLAVSEPGSYLLISSPQLKAVVEGKGYVLQGTKLFVPDAHLANPIIVVARTREGTLPEQGMTLFMVDARSPGIQCTPLKTLARDKQFEVHFQGVRVSEKDILGEIDLGWPVIEDIMEKAAVARGAEMIGGAQAALDMALDYAKIRIQFDHPIGSFQAVQHHFANMWMDINASRALLYKAAWMISAGKPASKEVAMAKARTGETFRRVTTLGHQIFGAIGFCKEHDFHLYYRRAAAGDQAFGNYDFQREKVAQALSL